MLKFSIWGVQGQNFQIENFKILGQSKSKLLASNQSDRWRQDVKIFVLEVLGFQNIEIEDFNILGTSKSKLLASNQPDRWPEDVIIFDFEVSKF